MKHQRQEAESAGRTLLDPAVTVFTSDRAPLAKQFCLVDGEIRKQSLATLSAGEAETEPARTATELASLLSRLHSRQALSAGRLVLEDRARISTRAKATGGERSRSLADFAYPQGPGWLLWDFDDKTMPQDVAARVEALGGPFAAFVHIWPEAAAGPFVIRPSSSDGVTAPGCGKIKSAGLHGFFLVEDVSRSRAALETLQERAWTEGLAWCALSKSGAVLIRSIVDVAVGSPERLIFEAPPILVAPLERHPRPALVRDAPTPLAIPATALDVTRRAARLEHAARQAIRPEAHRVEDAFVEARAEREAARTGKPIEDARASVRQMLRGAILADDHLLQMKDGSWRPVGELLDNPQRFDRLAMPDPVEGLAYGPDKATLFLRPRPGLPDDKPALVSHAHGQRTVYRFARYKGPSGRKPFHEAPPGSREEALARHPDAVREFFTKALGQIRAAREVQDAYEDIDPDLDPAARRRSQAQARREVQGRHELDYLPTARLREAQEPPRVMLGGAQGVGKTRAAIEGLSVARGMVSLVLVPDHAKAGELVAAYTAEANELSPVIERLKGREALEGPGGPTLCRIPKAAKAVAERGLSVPGTLCLRCPFQEECGYLAQEARLKRLAAEPSGLVIVAPREYGFLPLPGHLDPDLVVFDEVPPDLGYKAEFLSFDELGEPLTYDGPKRRKGQVAETSERADALAALLTDVRPVLVATRDAYQGAPEAALRALRASGVDDARLKRVLSVLDDYEDRRLAERLGAQMDAFSFASLSGKRFDLDKRLTDTISDHEGKQLRAIRCVLEALRIELGHGRDEPVAVLRSEDVGKGRKGVVAHLIRQAHFGPEVPLLHLDGTGDHRIAEIILGPLHLEWHPVERRAEVTQVTGRRFSRQGIVGLNAKGEPVWPENAARLRADLVALCHAQPSALVVANKAVVAALKTEGLWNETAHFGALRGRNAWEAHDAIIVIGREQPSPSAVEGPGRALAVRAGDLFTAIPKGERWPTERRGLRLRSGPPVEIEVERHPDPWGDRVLRQIREAEVLQALDRVRPHFKSKPVRVTLLTPLALDVTVDRVQPWAEARRGGSKVERALRQGVLPLSVSEAARCLPQCWPNLDAAKRDQELQKVRALGSGLIART